MALRVLIVDDHPLFCEGVKALLDQRTDFSVVGISHTGRDTLGLFESCLPDVVLMDLGLPDEPGHKVIERLIHKYPRTRVLVLTTFEGDEDIHRALENGALGYVLKTVEAATLIEAMRKVAAGQRHVPSALAQRLVEHLPRPGLSARETEVLELMAEGLSNKEIGARLRLAVGTVKGHVNHLLSKLGVSDRTHAVSSAIRRGFLRR